MSAIGILPITQYAARTRDCDVLWQSTSGGVFTELARTVIRNGGVVAGASWDRGTFAVVHKIASSESELADLRGAKYVRSDISGVIKQVKELLGQGRQVLFTGTPCQVAVVRKAVGNARGNLILCAIVCHSAVDPDVWRSYLTEIKAKAKSPIRNIQFRNKRDGWRHSRFVVEFEDSRYNISQPLAENPYVRAFFLKLSSPECCAHCQFKSGRSGADIVIGDFWGIENCLPLYDDGKGISAVLIYTSLGRTLFESLDIEKTPVTYLDIVAKNPCVEKNVTHNAERRHKFFAEYRRKGIGRAIRIAEGNTLFCRAVNFLKRKIKAVF